MELSPTYFVADEPISADPQSLVKTYGETAHSGETFLRRSARLTST
jgi:hypothetical protein